MENSAGTPPTVAGWYDDPDDANFTRYFNGRNWTGDKVSKERNLTFNSDKVYRPGGVSKREEPAPAELEVKDDYQPLTRRERREREQAEQLKRGVPVAVDNDMEFEFQTAHPTQKSYVRSEEPASAEAEELIETPLPLPALEEAETSTDLHPLELSEEDSEFSFGDFPPLDSTEDEPEDDETPSLPELDFSGVGSPVAAGEQDDADDLPESPDEDDATPALPTLDFSSEDAPAAGDEDDFEWSVPEAKEVRYVPAKEDGIDFFSEDDFIAAPVKGGEDLLDDGEVEIVIPPVTAAEPVRRSYERPAPVEAPAPVAKKAEPVKEPEAAVKEADEDDAPVGNFGFASKLNKWKGDATEAEPVAEEKEEPESKTTALPAVAPADEEESSEESDSDDEEEDDDTEDEDEEPRGIRSRFKSFFSRNRNDDDVLEDEEGEDDDEDGEDETEDEPVEEAPEKEKPAPVSQKAPADTAPETDEDDADESDDEIPMEEPQLKAGLFSSRQEKEDAATELNLLGRLQELANRVAALKKEEADLVDRIERSKKEEKEINDRIVHAHEEHEVLDNLAKARRAEQQKETSREEDADLLSIIDSHTRPEDIPMDDLIDFEEEEPEEKPKAEYEPGEDDSQKPILPQLKF